MKQNNEKEYSFEVKVLCHTCIANADDAELVMEDDIRDYIDDLPYYVNVTETKALTNQGDCDVEVKILCTIRAENKEIAEGTVWDDIESRISDVYSAEVTDINLI